MSLTRRADGTATTVSNPGSRDHTHRSVVWRRVVLADKALPLEDNAVCHQPEGKSRVPPGFLLALHAPTVAARSDGPLGDGAGDGKLSV